MSQAGIIDVVGTNPDIPTTFETDSGSAVPIANVLEILGDNGIETDGSGNTVTVSGINATAGANVGATQIGVSSFDSASFTVTDGFVEFIGGGGACIESVQVDANTAPGTDPVLPDGTGVLTISGAAVAQHAVPIETHSRAANALNVEVQYSGSAASTTANVSGVCHFDSSQFTVDGNGFVEFSGTALPTSFTADSGSATPAANNLDVLGSNGIATSGATDTLTIAGIDATDSVKGVASFALADFGVVTGAVSLDDSVVKTLTSDAGMATGVSHNLDVVGSGGIATSATGDTLTIDGSGISTGVQSVTGTTDRITITGTATDPIVDIASTYVGQTSITTLGTVATGTWEATDVTVAHGGTGRSSATEYAVICGGTTTTNPHQSIASVGTAGQVLTSNGAGALPTFETISNNITVTTPGAYPYTQLATDDLILVDTSSARTINLQGSPATGKQVIIKDNVGSAGTNNITISPAAGNIDGAASFIMNANYASITIVYNGTEWSIL